MAAQLPEIAKAANRLLLDMENAVMRFPRRHKYVIGIDLRNEAKQISRCVYKAWREREHRLQRIQELAAAIDDLKLTMQLGKDMHAFGSFAEFAAVARLVNDIGRQCGGWLRQKHSSGQNGQAETPVQRSMKLSSGTASPEAAL